MIGGNGFEGGGQRGPPAINSLLAAAALSHPLSVIQPVVMSNPQAARTAAYLQHSIAPIATNPGVGGAAIGSPFAGPFPTPPADGARASVFPQFFSPAFPGGGMSGPQSMIPMPMPMPMPGPVHPGDAAGAAPIQPGDMPGAMPMGAIPMPMGALPGALSAAHAPMIQSLSIPDSLSHGESKSSPGGTPPTTYAELKRCVTEQGSRINLPTDSSTSGANLEIPLDPSIRQFVSDNMLLDTLALVEYTCRRAAALPSDPGAVSMVDVAKHLLNFMSAHNQLPGWAHVEHYIRSPTTYVASTLAKLDPIGVMDELISKGDALVMRLCARINWVLSLQSHSDKRADPEILMRVISAMAAAAVMPPPLLRSVAASQMLSASFHGPIHNLPSGTQIRICGDHPTAKYTRSNLLLSTDHVINDFTERAPNATPSTLCTERDNDTPEEIRVQLLHDSSLHAFLSSVKYAWPKSDKPDRERVQYAIYCIDRVCGGTITTETEEMKTTAIMNRIMTEQDLPFVMLGDALGRSCLGCRYRSLLFKCIADHSVEFPAEWANAPLRGVELRRSVLRNIHEGTRAHSFNVIDMDGKTCVVDMEQRSDRILIRSVAQYEQDMGAVSPKTGIESTQSGTAKSESTKGKSFKIKYGGLYLGDCSALRFDPPPAPKPQTFAEQLIPYNVDIESFDIKHITTMMTAPYEPASASATATAGLSIVTMPPISMDELSRRFARDLFLSFGDHVADGFCWRSSATENIAFDASVDSDLAQCTMYARNLMRMYVGGEKRAIVLAKFVSMKFGIPTATQDKAVAFTAAIRAETRENTVPIGRLLAESVGLPIHRALLFKYLADMTVSNPVLWSSARSKPESVQCSLQIESTPTPPARGNTLPGIGVVVMVMVDGTPFQCDLSGDTVKLMSVNGKEVVETKSTTPAGAPTIVEEGQSFRVLYSDMSDYYPLRPGMGTVKLKGRVATIMTSISGHIYDTARFVAEMEALSAARHYHLAQVLGIAYYDIAVNNTAPIPIPTLAQSNGSLVPGPQLVGLFELLHGSTLAETLRRSDGSVLMEDRVRACLQMAQALSHLHGLSIPYGSLSPINVRIDERSFDIKLAGLDLFRYVLRSAKLAMTDDIKVQVDKANAEAEESTRASAAAFWAPEKFADPQTVTRATDVYAFGCMLYSILTLSLPFNGLSFEAMRTEVREGRRPVFDRARSSAIPADLMRLSTECMADRSDARPTIDQCVDRLRSCLDLKTLLRVTGDMQWSTNPNANPNLRNSANATAGADTGAGNTAPDCKSTGGIFPVAASAPHVINGTRTQEIPVSEEPQASTTSSGQPALPTSVTAATRAAAETKAQLMVEAMSNPLQPLNPQYGDGPTVEQCDATREQALSRLGVIDKKMLVGEHVATCALYIIHRTHSGNVALVTRGLSDPSNDSPGTTGLGVELLAEAKEADVGTGSVLGSSFLFQMQHEVAGNCRQFGLKLRQLIDVHGLVSMELNNVDAPPMFTDPHTNRTCVLLGIPSPDVPESFLMPGNLKVRIVTVRLLTFEECIVIRRFGAAGRKAIAELFARDGTHHISNIKQPPRPPLDMDIREIKTNVLGSTEALLLTGGGRVVVEAVRAAPKPSEDTVWDADKVRKRFIELQLLARGSQTHAAAAPAMAPPLANIPVATAALPAATLAVGSGAMTAAVTGAAAAAMAAAAMQLGSLPPIDELVGRSELEVKAVFPQFSKSTAVSSAMSRFDMRIRQIIGTANHPAQGLAKHVNNALSTQTQLAGWKHVQDYIVDPKAYLDRLKPARTSEQVARIMTAPEQPRAIDVLQATAERLLRRLLMRLEWLLDLQTRAKEEFDPDLFLQVLSLDTKWMEESTTFIREAELKVTDLLKRNSQRFGAFRDLQKRGVQWPHSPRLRKDIESAGFVFKPMMVKRDRCVCEQCGMEIAGWRPWHNPWQMHNLSKHSADFHERVSRFGTAFPQTGLYTFTIGPRQGAADAAAPMPVPPARAIAAAATEAESAQFCRQPPP